MIKTTNYGIPKIPKEVREIINKGSIKGKKVG